MSAILKLVFISVSFPSCLSQYIGGYYGSYGSLRDDYPEYSDDYKEYNDDYKQYTEALDNHDDNQDSNNNNTGASQDVFINNYLFNPAQLKELRDMYGVEPVPGRYWYDSKSGAYGVEGGAALGLMKSGEESIYRECLEVAEVDAQVMILVVWPEMPPLVTRG